MLHVGIAYIAAIWNISPSIYAIPFLQLKLMIYTNKRNETLTEMLGHGNYS